MKWRLRIVHVGLEQNGSATIVLAEQLAEQQDGPDTVIRQHSMLIDGGFAASAARVAAVARDKLEKVNNQGWLAGEQTSSQHTNDYKQRFDAVVITHFDADHVNGITEMLQSAARDLFRGARFYDPGFKTDNINKIKKDKELTTKSGRPTGPGPITFEYEEGEVGYRQALQSLIKESGTTHRTGGVCRNAWWNDSESQHVAKFEPSGVEAARSSTCSDTASKPQWMPVRPAHWLIGRELLPVNEPRQSNDSVTNIPSVKCIAVNGLNENDICEYTNPEAVGVGRGDNNTSIGLLITLGNFRYFTAGDLESDYEENLIDYIGNLDVLFASHHGSKNSSSERFLQATNPNHIICSNGSRNMHGHPDDEAVLRMLQVDGALIYTTGVPPVKTGDQPAEPQKKCEWVRTLAGRANPSSDTELSAQNIGDRIRVEDGDIVIAVEQTGSQRSSSDTRSNGTYVARFERVEKQKEPEHEDENAQDAQASVDSSPEPEEKSDAQDAQDSVDSSPETEEESDAQAPAATDGHLGRCWNSDGLRRTRHQPNRTQMSSPRQGDSPPTKRQATATSSTSKGLRRSTRQRRRTHMYSSRQGDSPPAKRPATATSSTQQTAPAPADGLSEAAAQHNMGQQS